METGLTTNPAQLTTLITDSLSQSRILSSIFHASYCGQLDLGASVFPVQNCLFEFSTATTEASLSVNDGELAFTDFVTRLNTAVTCYCDKSLHR